MPDDKEPHIDLIDSRDAFVQRQMQLESYCIEHFRVLYKFSNLQVKINKELIKELNILRLFLLVFFGIIVWLLYMK